MQRIVEELTNARGHILIARNQLWQKRGEIRNFRIYNDSLDVISSLEGMIVALEADKEETCET